MNIRKLELHSYIARATRLHLAERQKPPRLVRRQINFVICGCTTARIWPAPQCQLDHVVNIVYSIFSLFELSEKTLGKQSFNHTNSKLTTRYFPRHFIDTMLGFIRQQWSLPWSVRCSYKVVYFDKTSVRTLPCTRKSSIYKTLTKDCTTKLVASKVHYGCWTHYTLLSLWSQLIIPINNLVGDPVTSTKVGYALKLPFVLRL